MAQQRHVIATQTNSRHVKLIAEMYDKCQETCKQYIGFLQVRCTAHVVVYFFCDPCLLLWGLQPKPAPLPHSFPAVPHIHTIHTCPSHTQMALPEDDYVALLPPIDVLRKQYGLDPEVQFHHGCVT